MDEITLSILKCIGIECKNASELEGMLIPREQLLCEEKYEEIKKRIPELKLNYSSSFMTGLQKNAEKRQKWPVLNLVRQILLVHKLHMEPIRRADGYTVDGVKKYKRYFLIERKIDQPKVFSPV